MRKLLFFIGLFFLTSCVQATGENKAGGIQWVDWTDDLFEKAKAENKYVILDLEAIWCHWCHVMEETTYSDDDVKKIIAKNYIAVKVDQDSRPDLSRRYQEYGWPATIFFGPDGTEIVKRSGYIAPDNMERLLQAIVDDPTPEPDSASTRGMVFNENALLSKRTRAELLQRHTDSYDPEYGGLKLGQKFLDRDTVEYAMLKALGGDKQNERIARHTLDEAIALIDPAFGGVYQYSTGGKWDYAHFEKIMHVQGSYMRIYALAYLQFKDPKYLKAAKDIERYLNDFLRGPNGAYYTSQDADLVQGEHSREYFELNREERLEQGMPRVDKNQYARENGWAVEGLSMLYAATGEDKYLQRARQSIDWVLKNRSLPDGGFRHAEVDKAGPYLGDSLAMGRALIALYEVTGERALLQRAEHALQFIDKTFRNDIKGTTAGYVVAYVPPKVVIRPEPQIDENIALARFAMRVKHYTGNKVYKGVAERVMRFLATHDIATQRLTEVGILLVDYELANDPTHITVVGKKDDGKAIDLFRTAMRYPGGYKRIEWWDKREGPMPNPDVQYPTLETAAAFACSNQRCSLPVFEPQGVHGMVDLLNGVGKSQGFQ